MSNQRFVVVTAIDVAGSEKERSARRPRSARPNQSPTAKRYDSDSESSLSVSSLSDVEEESRVITGNPG